MINSGMLTSNTPEWATPQDFFDELDKEFAFTLDPCATAQNAKCVKYYTAQDNGLAQNWSGEKVFMNPPYGRTIKDWMAKAVESWRDCGATVVCLVPARTDTAWWHDYAMLGEIRFIRGRLRFGNSVNAAPFPSAVVIFRQKEEL